MAEEDTPPTTEESNLFSSLYPEFAESETETEPDPIPPSQFCFPCYPRSHEWFVQVQEVCYQIYNKANQNWEDLLEEQKIYGDIRYLSSYHARRFPTSICEIFDNLILPPDNYIVRQDGITLGRYSVDEITITQLLQRYSDCYGAVVYKSKWYIKDRENLYDIKILEEQNI